MRRAGRRKQSRVGFIWRPARPTLRPCSGRPAPYRQSPPPLMPPCALRRRGTPARLNCQWVGWGWGTSALASAFAMRLLCSRSFTVQCPRVWCIGRPCAPIPRGPLPSKLQSPMAIAFSCARADAHAVVLLPLCLCIALSPTSRACLLAHSKHRLGLCVCGCQHLTRRRRVHSRGAVWLNLEKDASRVLFAQAAAKPAISHKPAASRNRSAQAHTVVVPINKLPTTPKRNLRVKANFSPGTPRPQPLSCPARQPRHTVPQYGARPNRANGRRIAPGVAWHEWNERNGRRCERMDGYWVVLASRNRRGWTKQAKQGRDLQGRRRAP